MTEHLETLHRAHGLATAADAWADCTIRERRTVLDSLRAKRDKLRKTHPWLNDAEAMADKTSRMRALDAAITLLERAEART